jgi:hypothetical protein
MLDWTESLYIAAFFAIVGHRAATASEVAIWIFDRARFVFEESGIDFIDDVDLIRFNPRALRQRGVFMRVRTLRHGLEDLLGEAVTKITIPVASVSLAQAHLDEMWINATSMYGDLDGAARTVRSRFNPPTGG